MKPVRIRDDVDPESPEYRRQLIIVTVIVVVLTLTGGSCLGYRIRQMETLNERGAAQQTPAEHDLGAREKTPSGPANPTQRP